MEEVREPDSALQPPNQPLSIGRYEIVHHLASGGMASVYVGRLAGIAGFEKLVAIKMIHPHFALREEFVDMFLDEARLAGRVHHPNVVEVYEVGNDGGQLYMVAEFISGRSLKHVLQAVKSQGRYVSKAMATWICAQVCEGLHAAHELSTDDGRFLNLVHRDISPNNILLSYDGYVKLIDFGVAFADDRKCQTTTGMVKGRLGFIAPEVLSGEPFDRRADIFSTGVTLYCLATGRHPFEGESGAKKVRNAMDGDYVRPSRVLKSIDSELENIIVKAMHPKPAKRFQTAAEMGQCLLKYSLKTRRQTGAQDIKRAMEHLFADSIAAHEQKLREFRESCCRSIVTVSGGAVISDQTVPGRKVTGGSDSWKIEDSSSTSREHPCSHGLRPRRSERSADLDAIDKDDDRKENRNDRVLSFSFVQQRLAALLKSALVRSTGFTIRLAVFGISMLIAVLTVAIIYSIGIRSEQISENSFGAADNGALPARIISVNMDQEPLVPKFQYSRALPTEPPQAAVPFSVDPPSAELKVNGKPAQRVNNVLYLPLDHNKHEIVVSAPGYFSETRSIVADKKSSLAIELVPEKKKKNFWGKRGAQRLAVPGKLRKNPPALLQDPY